MLAGTFVTRALLLPVPPIGKLCPLEDPLQLPPQDKGTQRISPDRSVYPRLLRGEDMPSVALSVQLDRSFMILVLVHLD